MTLIPLFIRSRLASHGYGPRSSQLMESATHSYEKQLSTTVEEARTRTSMFRASILLHPAHLFMPLLVTQSVYRVQGLRPSLPDTIRRTHQ